MPAKRIDFLLSLCVKPMICVTLTNPIVRRTLMTDLSPATQAVIDASNCAGSRIVQLHIADAFRALAVRINGADAIRQDILDIAAELENQ
jgi:hypothetical protein